MKHLQRFLKSPDDFIQGSASLCDVLGLTKGVKDALVLVNLLVELGLELLLGHADHEVSNELRDGLSDRADSDLEDRVDTGANLFHEQVCSAGPRLLRLLYLLLLVRVTLRLVLDSHTVLVVLRQVLLSGHDRGAVLFVVSVVDEHVVLLGVDDGFDELTSVIALPLQDLADDVHDFGAKAWAPHEDALDDG